LGQQHYLACYQSNFDHQSFFIVDQFRDHQSYFTFDHYRVYYSKDTDYYYTESIFFGNQSNFNVDQLHVYYTKDTDYFYKPIFFGNHSNVTRHFVARFIDQFFDKFLNLFPTPSCISNSGVSSNKELIFPIKKMENNKWYSI
jgi:hypothetical protein